MLNCFSSHWLCDVSVFFLIINPLLSLSTIAVLSVTRVHFFLRAALAFVCETQTVEECFGFVSVFSLSLSVCLSFIKSFYREFIKCALCASYSLLNTPNTHTQHTHRAFFLFSICNMWFWRRNNYTPTQGGGWGPPHFEIQMPATQQHQQQQLHPRRRTEGNTHQPHLVIFRFFPTFCIHFSF